MSEGEKCVRQGLVELLADEGGALEVVPGDEQLGEALSLIRGIFLAL